MYFNRVDIVEAYYLFFMHYHEGQGSKKYRRLCKISNYFTPSPNFGINSLSENGQAIYDNLAQNEQSSWYDEMIVPMIHY